MTPALFLLASVFYLAPDLQSPAVAETARFAPAFCPYAVQFPGVVQASATSSADGSKIAAVEQVIGGLRLSAFCAASGQTIPAAALDPKERQARIRGLVNDLQIADATIDDVGLAEPDCSEVHGALVVNGVSYRILSRLCMRTDSTFIAEAVFSAKADEETAGSFVASLTRSVAPAGIP